MTNLTCATRIAIAAAAFGLVTGPASADIERYRFELVDAHVQAGPDEIFTVRLLDGRTGQAVPDAVIFATRLDMAPDGMQEMATKIVQLASEATGCYRFRANFAMAGRWQLSLGAKVQGETGTVESRLVVTARK